MVYDLIHLSGNLIKLCSYLDFWDVNILYPKYSYLIFLLWSPACQGDNKNYRVDNTHGFLFKDQPKVRDHADFKWHNLRGNQVSKTINDWFKFFFKINGIFYFGISNKKYYCDHLVFEHVKARLMPLCVYDKNIWSHYYISDTNWKNCWTV